MPDKTDIAIIGAGLAGLACARSLAGSGLRVTLIDRKASLSQRVHTTGIFVRKTLDSFDLPADCLGPPVRHVELVSPRGRRLRLASEHDEFRVGRMGALYERWLAQSMAHGTKFVSGTRLIGIEPDGEASLLSLARGLDRFSLRARFVIGADGARSAVARALGLDINQRFLVGIEDVFHGIHLEGPPRFECHVDPVLAPGYIAWVVHDGVETHIGTGGVAGGFDPRAALDAFYHRLGRTLDLTSAKHVERRGGRIPVGGMLSRLASTRGLLVGDATGAVSPLTAGGLDPALRLSDLAAAVTREFLRSGDSRVLEMYRGERFKPRFTSRLFARRILECVRSPALIEFGFAASQIQPFRSFAWHVFFGRGSFPDVHADVAAVSPQPA